MSLGPLPRQDHDFVLGSSASTQRGGNQEAKKLLQTIEKLNSSKAKATVPADGVMIKNKVSPPQQRLEPWSSRPHSADRVRAQH